MELGLDLDLDLVLVMVMVPDLVPILDLPLDLILNLVLNLDPELDLGPELDLDPDVVWNQDPDSSDPGHTAMFVLLTDLGPTPLATLRSALAPVKHLCHPKSATYLAVK